MLRLIHASMTAKTSAMPRTMSLTEDHPDIWHGFMTEALLLLIQGTLAVPHDITGFRSVTG